MEGTNVYAGGTKKEQVSRDITKEYRRGMSVCATKCTQRTVIYFLVGLGQNMKPQAKSNIPDLTSNIEYAWH